MSKNEKVRALVSVVDTWASVGVRRLRGLGANVATIGRRATKGQALALALGVLVLIGSAVLVVQLFLASAPGYYGLGVLGLMFVGVVALGLRSMARALLGEPSPSLAIEERPLPMGFWSLSTDLQSFVRYMRATRQILVEQLHTRESVESEARSWLRQLDQLDHRDRRVLEENGINVRELYRVRHRLNRFSDDLPSAADGCRELDAILRDVENRLLGEQLDHPLRRNAR